jgi:hypothetical protein
MRHAIADERMSQGVTLQERIFTRYLMIRGGTLTRSRQAHLVEGGDGFVAGPPRRPEEDRWQQV